MHDSSANANNEDVSSDNNSVSISDENIPKFSSSEESIKPDHHTSDATALDYSVTGEGNAVATLKVFEHGAFKIVTVVKPIKKQEGKKLPIRRFLPVFAEMQVNAISESTVMMEFYAETAHVLRMIAFISYQQYFTNNYNYADVSFHEELKFENQCNDGKKTSFLLVKNQYNDGSINRKGYSKLLSYPVCFWRVLKNLMKKSWEDANIFTPLINSVIWEPAVFHPLLFTECSGWRVSKILADGETINITLYTVDTNTEYRILAERGMIEGRKECVKISLWRKEVLYLKLIAENYDVKKGDPDEQLQGTGWTDFPPPPPPGAAARFIL